MRKLSLKTRAYWKSLYVSPCKTAFSCGVLAKYPEQKSAWAAMVKEISSLEGKFEAARRGIGSTSQKKLQIPWENAQKMLLLHMILIDIILVDSETGHCLIKTL